MLTGKNKPTNGTSRARKAWREVAIDAIKERNALRNRNRKLRLRLKKLATNGTSRARKAQPRAILLMPESHRAQFNADIQKQVALAKAVQYLAKAGYSIVEHRVVT